MRSTATRLEALHQKRLLLLRFCLINNKDNAFKTTPSALAVGHLALQGCSESLRPEPSSGTWKGGVDSQGSTLMSSPKKKSSRKKPHDMSADELMREINKLNSLLQDKLKTERDTEEDEHQRLLKKMLGRPIRITLEGDPLHGQEAVITGPRGDSKNPMCWRFPLSSGENKCKARTSFKLLPCDASPQGLKLEHQGSCR